MKVNRLNVENVIRYPYRTARVKKIITLNRSSQDGVELESWLNTTTNNTRDNHVCFGIREKGGSYLYIMFTDNNIHIGTTIIVGSW